MRFLFFRSISIIKSLEGWYQSPLFLLSLPPSVSIFSTLMFNVFKFVSKLFHILASFAVQTFWIQIRIDKTSGPDQDSVGLTIVLFGFFCCFFFVVVVVVFFFRFFLRMISFLLFFCLFVSVDALHASQHFSVMSRPFLCCMFNWFNPGLPVPTKLKNC